MATVSSRPYVDKHGKIAYDDRWYMHAPVPHVTCDSVSTHYYDVSDSKWICEHLMEYCKRGGWVMHGELDMT